MIDAEEIKGSFTKGKVIALAEREGLQRKGGKLQCPARCSEKADSCSLNDKNGTVLWHCHRCGVAGDVIRLIETTRTCDFQAALAWLAENEGSIKEAQWRKPKNPAPAMGPLWETMPTEDQLGSDYLASRGLLKAVAIGAVRFNVGRSSYRWLNAKARDGFRVAVPMYSVDGRVSHLQLRSVLTGGAGRESKLSTPGSYPPGGVAMGCTREAPMAEQVYLTEGIADTLALQIAGVTVIGAPGAEQVFKLLHFLGEVRDRQIVLCPQNDESNLSQRAFSAVGQKLLLAGARVLLLPTAKEYKDPAEWNKAVGTDEFRRLIRIAVPKASADSASENHDGATAAIALASVPADPWPAIVAESGVPQFGKTYASLCLILRHNRQVLPEPLRFDDMLCSPTVAGRPLEDQDTARIREQIELHQPPVNGTTLKFGIEDIERAVLQVAHEQRFHPVRDYLKSLVWDGIPRLEGVAEKVLGIARTKMNQLLLRKWFIGTAKRPLNPGCKMDTVIVLVGRQYLGKSSFFSTLAGRPEWFSDDHVDIENRDSLMLLQSVWILEWGELATMQRAKDLETLKAFITSCTNKFRLPYGRRIVERPRHSVVVGTTNKGQFLADPTGNRRFWPILVDQPIDLGQLAAWRDQLWAEAVAAAEAGERYWLDEEEDRQLAALQQPHEETHPWEDPIQRWLEENAARANPHLITTANVLEHAVKKPPGQWTKRDEMDVGSVLRRLGYERPANSRADDGEGHRVRVWVSADPAPQRHGRPALVQP